MIDLQKITISTIRSGKGDCIHLRFVSDKPYNIIIDTGPSSATGQFRHLCETILKSGEDIDCLLITHYDDDHIGGALKVTNIPFKNVYFNAYDGVEDSSNLSAKQNQRLFHTLPQTIVHSFVLASDKIQIGDAVLSVLAPSNEQLSKAKQEMKRVETPLSSITKDWNLSLKQLMEKTYPEPDASISNQSSIVFIFELNGLRMLFCGDAPAYTFVDGVDGHFDLVKLPHHGSIKNISEALLSRIDADKFLICADGTSHPSKHTIAKIIQYYDCPITIYSNYSWWSNGFWQYSDNEIIKTKKLQLIEI